MKHIISSLAYLIVLFCLSTFVFGPTHLYHELPWLDIPMHILGGFGVVSLALSVSSYKKKNFSYKKVMLVYLVVAISWELCEFAHDLFDQRVWNGWQDTLSDVVNGGIGAIVAYRFLKK